MAFIGKETMDKFKRVQILRTFTVAGTRAQNQRTSFSDRDGRKLAARTRKGFAAMGSENRNAA